MFTTKCIVARLKSTHYAGMHIFSPSSHLACFQLVCFPSRYKVRGLLGNTNRNILPKPSLKINLCQTRKHDRVIFICISWAPNEHALILRSRPTSFFFCASRRPVKRNWVKGYALFIVWPVVASENNAFIWHFLSFYRSKVGPI